MVNKLSDYVHSKKVRRTSSFVEKINNFQMKYHSWSDEALKKEFLLYKQQKNYDKDICCHVFAIVKEAIKRVLNIDLHDVQLMAGWSLADGKVPEMATGEGKTVMSVLPACWNALQGKKVHIMTVNEYLAKRDFEEMGRVFSFLGITVGLNHTKLTVPQKKQAYKQDVTYGICSEFGFDYLKDHLVKRKESIVQPTLEVVIVDEIDSILIDEAKTPLIISEKRKAPPDIYAVCSKLVSKMEEERDYEIDLRTQQVIFTERAIKYLEAVLMIENLYDGEHAHLFHFLLQSLRAHVFMTRDEHYIVKDGKVELIDPFTGRILEGRQYNDGLHQAIEAKEGLPLSEENGVKATITLQKLFSLYETVIGMTGTIQTEEEEIYELYGIEVVQIPTHKPVIREDLPDDVFPTKQEKNEAVIAKIKESFNRGQPVLVGTTSVAQSEHLAQLLSREKVPFQLLNAKTEKEEAAMIAKAGNKGMITIATNMAGRGTDIKLDKGVAELGGLYVIGTEKHESRRIDLQLRGRAGRQGDPGKSKFFLSLEDELITRFAMERIAKDKTKLFNTIQKEVEEQNYAIRTIVYLLDSVVHDQRSLFYKHRRQILEGEYFLETLGNHVITYMTSQLNEAFEEEDEVKRRTADQLDKLKPQQTNQLYQQYLSLIDEGWANHLDTLHHLKQSLHSRVYEQRDPILIFHDEAWKLYYSMEDQIREKLFNKLTHLLKEGEQHAGPMESPSYKAI